MTDQECVLTADAGAIRIRRMLTACPADLREVLDREVGPQARLLGTGDFAEVIAAFGEQCTPVFRGR